MTDDETKAMRDALTFGTGYMLDGKHVPMEAVMTDDLVKQLRKGGSYEEDTCLMEEAADRVEELELVLRAICRTATDNVTRNLAINALEGNQIVPTERPEGCKYEPCRGLTTGFCDCN